MIPFWHRTWIDIDLDALLDNYRAVCNQTSAVVTCVLKANAYGHGARQVARALQKAGCASFAVSSIQEGLELRQEGIRGEILVMGLSDAELLESAILAGLTLTAASIEDLQRIERTGAKEAYTVSVHLKIDTGFHRLGFGCSQQDIQQLSSTVRKLFYTRIEGIYTHLGLTSRQLDERQYERLCKMKQLLADQGLVIDEMHICDSLGFVRYPEWHGSRVRIGALLYGSRPPTDPQSRLSVSTRETLCFRTRIAQIHFVPKGDHVGYSDGTPLDHDARIATLCAGYGDGYPRHLSNGKGAVMIRGKEAPVVGLVCMDQMMVEVTDIPEAKAGDPVDLLGGSISYTSYAARAETNRNECLTILSRRPVRVYHQNGEIAAVQDDLRHITWPHL